MKYGIAKMRAQEFANERQQPVYIAHAKQNGHCIVLFEEDVADNEIVSRNRPQHEIIETIYPETATL